MKVSYRGFDIEAKREPAMGGWDAVYFTVIRQSDGMFLIDDFTTASDPVREIVKGLKSRVDEAIATKGESECITGWEWQGDKAA